MLKVSTAPHYLNCVWFHAMFFHKLYINLLFSTCDVNDLKSHQISLLICPFNKCTITGI